MCAYLYRLAKEEMARRKAEERAKREEEAQRQAEERRRKEEEERKVEEEKEREEAERLQKQVRQCTCELTHYERRQEVFRDLKNKILCVSERGRRVSTERGGRETEAGERETLPEGGG